MLKEEKDLITRYPEKILSRSKEKIKKKHFLKEIKTEKMCYITRNTREVIKVKRNNILDGSKDTQKEIKKNRYS